MEASKARSGQGKSQRRFKVLKRFHHEGHEAVWVEFETAFVGGTIIPAVKPRAFHCECYFEQGSSAEEACEAYQALLMRRYQALTTAFKSHFKSGARAFLPDQIETIIEELVRMVNAGEFVEPDESLLGRGVLLRDVTLARIIELPDVAARGHLTRYATSRQLLEVSDGMLQESY